MICEGCFREHQAGLFCSDECVMRYIARQLYPPEPPAQKTFAGLSLRYPLPPSRAWFTLHPEPDPED